ncbi:MAG: hypothetical protein HKN17_09655, partial [Rhodothermales bacterium]|nr:hypothetical protein [Rhodothermales bacterium]
MPAYGHPSKTRVDWIILFVLFMTAAAVFDPDPVRGQSNAEGTFLYEDAPLRSVLADVRERAGYHFLYRDVLVAGKSVSFSSSTEDVLDHLNTALTAEGLRLHVDDGRHQVLLVEDHPASEEQSTGNRFSIHGIVMDDEHGTRLPYATVAWRENGRLRGVAVDATGHFRVQISPEAVGPDAYASGGGVELSVSHIGYVTRQLRVARDAGEATIPVRLVPETTRGPEVIVSATALAGEVDTTWHHLLQAGLVSPLGESGVMRSLQTLPSVSLSTAATAGLNVRGSRADGFQVLLDGMSIYNQSHLFGLFDAFNAEVLQTVGLYYAIAPASLQGPPGGTLAYVTRTGSMTDVHGSLGASNTSGKGTLEGPFAGGRGSWLVSGRHSWLNAFDLFDSGELIRLGLDVGRETDVPTGPVREIPVSALTTGEASADFYDVHGKLAFEWEKGARLTASGYAGGDETLHRAERLVDVQSERDVRLIQADTRNNWFNAAASVGLQTPYGTRAFTRTEGGLSRYRSTYSKDDFVYTDPTRLLLPVTDTTRHVVRPFSNENHLLEVKLAQQVDISSGASVWSAGYALHHFEIDYREESIFRGGFEEKRKSIQADAFLQADGRPVPAVGLSAGLRTHYFQHGGFFRFSPRLRVRFIPDGRLSFGGGYSRNHQCIHRLYLEQSTHADIWV